MRPIRLLLHGFGCYREPAEADFSDVEFFALTGPTGSGKSTVIDGLCFALYGTVPRWSDKGEIRQALAPAANACTVALVFEASGQRYGIVRELARNARGDVGTKEARIERLDASVPASAPLADLLASATEALAEGPREVTLAVQEILGLSYEHFTQSVLLPQGRFAEFLRATAGERQKLLVELLAFGVYTAIGQRARERAKLEAGRLRDALAAREEISGATQEAEDAAAGRVVVLDELSETVVQRLASLDQLREQGERAAQQASDARRELAVLAAVQTPAAVADLASRIATADRLLADRANSRDRAEEAGAAARQARDALGDTGALQLAQAAYIRRRDLEGRLAAEQHALGAARERQLVAQAEVATAEGAYTHARDHLAHAERSDMALALAQDLRVGDDCPVCLRPVSELPSLPAGASLADARAAVDQADGHLARARATHQQAAAAAAAAGVRVDGSGAELARLGEALAGAPPASDVTASLEAIEAADQMLVAAQRAAQAARDEALTAEKERFSLADAEQQARAALGRARDTVVGFGAPQLSTEDLAAGWATLVGWARQQCEKRRVRQSELDANAVALAEQVTGAEQALAALLAEHGIAEVADPARAEAAVATARANAQHHLDSVRADRERASRLDEQVGAHREAEQVASKLGTLLRATAFEGWICGAALDSLVDEASQVLMELSGGQYQLDRDERNDLWAIDYADAGARRPVHTLSGGETFQASLALALALSRQVVGLSGNMREMNSMFLDEGFGTLDPDTLETVGGTLEGLAADSDRMIGIVTHVSDLAQRAGTRFVVSRSGGTSTLRKVGP